MKKVLAIDPGQTGAFVYLDSKGYFDFELMPIIENGKDKDVDFEAVRNILKGFLDVDAIFLERAAPHAMGSKHAFNYGRGFAAIEIAVKLSEIPVVYVEPAKWTKVMHEGISNDLKPKAKSLIAVERLYKKLLPKIPRTPKSKALLDGVVDALLIAGYGLRKGI